MSLAQVPRFVIGRYVSDCPGPFAPVLDMEQTASEYGVQNIHATRLMKSEYGSGNSNTRHHFPFGLYTLEGGGEIMMT